MQFAILAMETSSLEHLPTPEQKLRTFFAVGEELWHAPEITASLGLIFETVTQPQMICDT